MRAIVVGDSVLVNKDIYRIPEGRTEHALYASRGTAGRVIEIFRVPQSGVDRLHAKVLTKAGAILTFRLTSLDRVDP